MPSCKRPRHPHRGSHRSHQAPNTDPPSLPPRVEHRPAACCSTWLHHEHRQIHPLIDQIRPPWCRFTVESRGGGRPHHGFRWAPNSMEEALRGRECPSAAVLTPPRVGCAYAQVAARLGRRGGGDGEVICVAQQVH